MARTDPGQEGTLLLATLFSMATTFCLYKLLRQFKSTRRTLNKFVRLSKQGPFYRGGSWLLGTLMRRTRGTAAIAAPGERCVPRVRLNERTTSSVDLIWTAERASTWSDDAYELQRRWAPGHAGAFEARDTPEKIQAARDAVDEWVTVYQGARAQYAFESLAPGTAFQVRARTTNSAGASAWSEPREHCSHQRPFENGGLGPGYAWTQSHASVTLLVPVGAGVRGRDVAAKCTSDAVRLSVGGVEVVAGKWREIVLPDEFTWEIDDDATVAPNLTGRRVLSATVAKCTETPFELWPNALKGHPTIDTKGLSGFGDDERPSFM